MSDSEMSSWSKRGAMNTKVLVLIPTMGRSLQSWTWWSLWVPSNSGIRVSEGNQPWFCLMAECCQQSPHELSSKKLIGDKRGRSFPTTSANVQKDYTLPWQLWTLYLFQGWAVRQQGFIKTRVMLLNFYNLTAMCAAAFYISWTLCNMQWGNQ